MTDLTGKLVVVFGGGGFIGRALVQALAAKGARVRVAQRQIEGAGAVRPLGNLGQVQILRADITHPQSVVQAVAGADAVVNLVGSWSGDLKALHVDGPRNLALAARDAGASQFVQVSGIGADPASDSQYGATKGEGEMAVAAAFPGATIVRPAVVFGPGDQFINRFARLASWLPALPVIGGTKMMQPIFVGDVAAAIVAVLTQNVRGRTLEIGGANALSMHDIMARVAGAIGRTPIMVPVPDAIAGAGATLTGWLPGAPITHDQWRMLRDARVPAKNALRDLGVVPTPFDAIVAQMAVAYRPHGRFTVAARP